MESEARHLPQGWPLIAVAFGAAIGVLAHVTLEQDLALIWEFGLVQAVLTAGLALVLTARPHEIRAPAVFSLVLCGVAVSLSTVAISRFGNDLAEQADSVPVGLAVQSVLFGLIAVTAFQAWQEREVGDATAGSRLGALQSIRYARVFEHLWGNVLIALVSACFVGLFWLLLVLFARLFESVGVEGFSDLIDEPMFIWAVTCAAVALAVVFLRQQDGMFSGLRSIVLTLFAALAPVFLVLSAGFLIVLLAGGFDRMASLVSASTTLLLLTGFGIVFVNSVVRDGDEAREPAKALRVSAILLLPCLTVFCGFAAYAIGLRIDQHGLTPDRVFVAATTGAVSLWCLAYLAGLLRMDSWRTWIRRTNLAMAFLVAGTIVALHSPFADPYRLAAENQYRRLASGAVSAQDFDYEFLRFHLGQSGRTILARLAVDSGKADTLEVAERLADLGQAEDIRSYRKAQRAKASDILTDTQLVRRVPDGLELPDDLSASSSSFISRALPQCGQDNGNECAVTAIDITDRTGTEYLLVIKRSATEFDLVLFERRENSPGWHTLRLPSAYEAAGLWSALLDGDLTAIPADHRDLQIGDRVIRLYRPNPLR